MSADLRRRCSELEAEARDAQAKVAPLEKRVSDLVQESLEWNTAAERYKGEVIQVETLLAQKVLALNQAQVGLAEARGQVSLWQGRAEENKKHAEGNSHNLIFVISVYVCSLHLPFYRRAGGEGGRGGIHGRRLAEVS